MNLRLWNGEGSFFEAISIGFGRVGCNEKAIAFRSGKQSGANAENFFNNLGLQGDFRGSPLHNAPFLQNNDFLGIRHGQVEIVQDYYYSSPAPGKSTSCL